jgi:hypothetical protein
LILDIHGWQTREELRAWAGCGGGVEHTSRRRKRTDGKNQVREHKEGRVLCRWRVVFVLVVMVPVAFRVRVWFFHVKDFARDLAPSP